MEREHPETLLIDLGVGEPDAMADAAGIDVLYEQAKEWKNRGYADNGILLFQQAAAAYLEEVFGVGGLCPETQILHSMGSKSALAMIPQAFINPGDITLMTVPGYPILGTKVAGRRCVLSAAAAGESFSSGFELHSASGAAKDKAALFELPQ